MVDQGSTLSLGDAYDCSNAPINPPDVATQMTKARERGAPTGPRTKKGMARSRRANWKHGFDSAAAKATRREARAILKARLKALRELTAKGAVR